ncbi:MAG: bifunctional phosphopantothenoylcysteine decarboxylase/phosphopantothenate--cysteine ligase CoaBC [Paenibacillus dendritiformis]|uniref:bifunctional phosphopantothenoylcysteine decarboxylase/phosphopantothenate--cysteine ligase CoaBC n=1 Tax=Paenibacillus dendritiformis TaxID=130049 RepID=UPI00143DBEE1|nr:bifunctional phosphopantothenoylcysteine decarboxylase/phosphopantothenate--cysteine ligase CoaBC [Paenibacillus dendritiformis]MDU5142269.1 bifunctional phosphopantothenoylcysteine decarboxylase/phosphopantothenate--cysteine ligase CoaBC [Paenibacillus dendritiformis]NKI24541.1 bifunctional phosphopantothenoylcysteine decarboxylase/phosphopantothenate--cysteine ligase CoaBC [Paenibacillus dendritiformis]NRG01237.1 bifunctional phosphopantothenoylcysteine decarboxylase/phosphopantothenate--cy
MLQGKSILLGVTGGIAAYKAAALCSKLKQEGAEVRVIMTASATQFISELTFQTLSRQPVYTDTFDERDPSVVSHIDLADHADLVLVAPATANVIAKMAHGLADDMLSTTLLATTAPVMVAPAMNVHMYAHPAVVHNMEILRSRGVRFIEPEEGLLACGYTGKGRLAEPEHIVEYVKRWFREGGKESALRPAGAASQGRERPGLLQGKRVLITAGGTVERIDPVRYITNDSSGKMGFAVAEAARDMGACVTVIAGQTQSVPPEGVELIRVETALDMRDAVIARYEDADIVVKAAAVADYRPVHRAAHKLKKTGERLVIELERNPDILQELGEKKKNQLLIGFAAETEQLEQYALDKLARKNLDFIVANDVSRPDAGFGSDRNEVHIYSKKGLVERIPLTAKSEVARRLLKIAAQRISAGGEPPSMPDEVHSLEP